MIAVWFKSAISITGSDFMQTGTHAKPEISPTATQNNYQPHRYHKLH